MDKKISSTPMSPREAADIKLPPYTMAVRRESTGSNASEIHSIYASSSNQGFIIKNIIEAQYLPQGTESGGN